MIPTVASPHIYSNSILPEGPISILPDEIITSIFSCLISAITTKRYAEACKLTVAFRNLPKPGSTNNEQMRWRLLRLKCFMGDKLSWFKTDLRIVRSPWKDLASFAGTCKRFHKLVHSKIYSDQAIPEEKNLAEEQICAFTFLIVTGKETISIVASRIKALQPLSFVFFGIEFSIERSLPINLKNVRSCNCCSNK
jgi:hypothetical protein